MLFSISCHRNANQDSIERLDKAQSYHKRAVNLYKNDSLEQSLSKFIDVLSLIETLPEDMTEEEIGQLTGEIPVDGLMSSMDTDLSRLNNYM